MADQSLTTRDSLLPAANEFQILQTVARSAAASGLYNGVGTEQKILMILLAARELGIKPMQALNGGLWNIQGKIEVSARLMTAMIRQARHSIKIKSLSDKECTLEGKRADNGDSFDSSFTIEEAQRAGLVRPGSNWIKYPQDMLYARALSRLARRLFADVIGTAYVEGEIRDSKEPIVEVQQEDFEIVDHSEQIQKFYQTFEESGYNRDLLKSYLEKVSKTYNKTEIEVINKANQNMDGFKANFDHWLSKPQEST